MDWLVTISAMLSAIASIAAAIAAFISLRVSKHSIAISESSALAEHHLSASSKYSEVVKELNDISREFSSFNMDLMVNWASEIECKDHRSNGGQNPRPLRHVISNGSEMLSNYGANNSCWGTRSASRAMLSIIRNGIDDITDDEYSRLLNIADGQYNDFEIIFGNIAKYQDIAKYPAFRWVYYQLMKRVSDDDWSNIWNEAWLENGWLNKYKIEYLKIKDIFENARRLLKKEREKLAHSSLPLNCNFTLNGKYIEILETIDNILDDCNIEKLEFYRDWRFKEDSSLLVLSAISLSYFLNMQLNLIYMRADI